MPRRDVNVKREAMQGLYSFQRGDPTLDAIRNLLAQMNRGTIPEDARPVAGLANVYEVDVVGAIVLYEDVPGGPVKILKIEASAS